MCFRSSEFLTGSFLILQDVPTSYREFRSVGLFLLSCNVLILILTVYDYTYKYSTNTYFEKSSFSYFDKILESVVFVTDDMFCVVDSR